MDKQEILQKSREENKGLDERERDALAQAGKISCAVGGVVCFVIILLEAGFTDFTNCSTWAVYLTMTGTSLVVKYVKLRQKHELVFGVLQLALAAVFLAMHLFRLIK